MWSSNNNNVNKKQQQQQQQPVKQSLTTVKSVVSVVQVVEEHLSANTDGNIVPSESEYVPVQAAAVGSGKKCLTYLSIAPVSSLTLETFFDNIKVCGKRGTCGAVTFCRQDGW